MSWWKPAPPALPEPPMADPDQSWRILDLVNDWLKHAETKAAATLAAAGVSGGVLYNLVKDQHDASLALSISAVTCAVFIILGGLSAAWALRPRLWSKDDPTSRIYFHHIARAHPKRSGGQTYLDAVKALTASQEDLVVEVAGQIWANAQVAKSKFFWANVALSSILIAILALGTTTLVLALESR